MAETSAAVVRLSCRLTLAWCPTDLHPARPKVVTVRAGRWLVLKQGNRHTSGVPASDASDTGNSWVACLELEWGSYADSDSSVARGVMTLGFGVKGLPPELRSASYWS
jgi:hypothetical protein